MRHGIAHETRNGAHDLRALVARADALVQAARDFEGAAEPLAPDGLYKLGELERAIRDYRRVRRDAQRVNAEARSRARS